MIDYIDGQQDCRDGIPADPNRNQSYQDGYSHQFHVEQVATHRSLHGY